MRCPSYYHDNRSDRRFCTHCGPQIGHAVSALRRTDGSRREILRQLRRGTDHGWAVVHAHRNHHGHGLCSVGSVSWSCKAPCQSSTSSMITATAAFVVLWFVAAAANMWIGVSQAGYSFREELPIFLLIFLLPSAVAMFVKWKFL